MARRRTKSRAELIEQLMREARRAGSLGSLHNRAAAELAGIGQTDWECLDVLHWTGPIAAGELARRVGVTSGAVTGVLDRLEKAGIARRAADPEDRRRVIVTLTPPEELAVGPRTADLFGRFGALAAEMDAVNDRFEDDQLAVILDWVRASNEAVERSTERMRTR